MSSELTPNWKRLLHKITPWLFVTCPEYNWHWRWETLCECGEDVLNLKTGTPYRRHIHSCPEYDWVEREKQRKDRIKKIRGREFQ